MLSSEIDALTSAKRMHDKEAFRVMCKTVTSDVQKVMGTHLVAGTFNEIDF